MTGATLTLGEVLRRTTDHLATAGSDTPRLDAELLLGKALGIERIELYMQLDRPLGEPELVAARELVGRRARREPLQYVLGEWQFRHLTLTVDRRALIPRPRPRSSSSGAWRCSTASGHPPCSTSVPDPVRSPCRSRASTLGRG